MRSKFSLNIIGPIICFFLLTIGIIFCTITFFSVSISAFYTLLVDIIPGAVLAWLIFGEFRTKMIVVVFSYDSITIKRYGGLGAPRVFYYNQLDGFSTSILDSINMAYEYLYFVKGGKKIGKISEYYHSNYAEMKTEIEGKLKDLGYIEFRYWDEIKESFS